MSITSFGKQDKEVVDQLISALKLGGEHAVLCADSHVGYSLPIGSVVAYKNKLCVNGVGYDIACGNKAVRLDISLDDVVPRISDIMDEIFLKISFGMGRTNNERVEHEIFDRQIWQTSIYKNLKDRAFSQLGTVGGGNHYVDVFVDDLDRIWVGVHFGSRGLGHTIATHFVKAAGGKDGVNAEPVLLDDSSELGHAYREGMELAGDYAYAGRDWVCKKVAEIIGGDIVEQVHNHHNFAWKETHFGEDYWVVRKGATPATPGQKGFVGGSMAECSVILEGVDSVVARQALYSTVHGAGRQIGRLAAKGKVKKGVVVREGLVNRAKWQAAMAYSGIELRGGDIDEAPECYKFLPEVLESHAGTVKILHTLIPIGVAMAGPENVDPYKD
jgi:tRNA-splicing ligase RtcB